MTRTDIHRPNAIVPADYMFVGFKYIGPYAGFINANQMALIEAHRAKTGGRYSAHDHGGTCGICGASAMYLAVFHHPISNTYINVGETCADKMDFSDEGFNLFRKTVKGEKGRIAAKVKAQATLADMGLTAMWDLYLAYPNLNEAEMPREESIICEMVQKLVKYGSISEKQISFAQSLLERISGRAALSAKRAAENAASAFLGAVGDRLTLTLTLQWSKSFETQYGMLTVHGFKDASGNIVIYKGNRIADNGETLTLKATVKAHEDREGTLQTIINRPKVA